VRELNARHVPQGYAGQRWDLVGPCGRAKCKQNKGESTCRERSKLVVLAMGC